MKSHIAEMEEEIDRVPGLRNKLLANNLESKNGETVFLRYPSQTPDEHPTRNDVFKNSIGPESKS
jgi:hypothetical protein